MKIIFVSYHYWPPKFGGGLLHTIERLEEMARRGHQVIARGVIVVNRRGGDVELAGDGAQGIEVEAVEAGIARDLVIEPAQDVPPAASPGRLALLGDPQDVGPVFARRPPGVGADEVPLRERHRGETSDAVDGRGGTVDAPTEPAPATAQP